MGIKDQIGEKDKFGNSQRDFPCPECKENIWYVAQFDGYICDHCSWVDTPEWYEQFEDYRLTFPKGHRLNP